MYKFEADPVYHYNESPQSNPLRWQLYYREENTFIPQTGQFRCKDYLNDVCAKYNGKNVVAYGFNTTNMKLNDEGTWLVLRFISHPNVFMHNIETCINKEVSEDKHLTMEVVDDKILMFIPRYYYNQTYLISLVSYIIRISNTKIKFKSFDDAMKSKNAQADRVINGKGSTLALSWRFVVPKEFQKYYTYYNETYNSLLDNYTDSTVHNCGVMSWAYEMTNEQINQKEVA